MKKDLVLNSRYTKKKQTKQTKPNRMSKLLG